MKVFQLIKQHGTMPFVKYNEVLIRTFDLEEIRNYLFKNKENNLAIITNEYNEFTIVRHEYKPIK